MNFGSLLNGIFEKFTSWLGDFFGSMLAIIPKAIFLLFSALTSGIDALQALIRKLVGLDKYYQGGQMMGETGVAVVGKDPLTEFIYGILGIGDSAYVYKGLNTVFWSLAIFGLIVLVVSTMIAIIKSHYNEDTEGTSPWKYIYTAIKAILAFAIMPVVVVFGMQLSTFVLRTLDNITTSQSSESAIKGVYGSDATTIFKGEMIEGYDYKVYGHYDLFGIGSPTATATFGGLLFKAAAYSANRARDGKTSVAEYQAIQVDGKQIFGSSNCTAFTSLQTEKEKEEYVAYQIDYAYINCLEFQTGLSYDAVVDAVEDSVIYNPTFDLWFKNNIKDFSKYDVSTVWLFYNLWNFNYIVGFGGAISILGILLSIIIGVMTRLIKGAALFLVYPTLLGIAPLDNFKAFKNWGVSFIQQVMMAFGSIIGINLVMLLLPYLNNLTFFNIWAVDAIVNVVLIVASLLMAKDFIGVVSGFVGGADALTQGEGMKGAVASTIKTGARITGTASATVAKGMVKTGKIAGRLGVAGVKTLGKGVGKVAGKINRHRIAKKVNRANQEGTKEYNRKKERLKQYNRSVDLGARYQESIDRLKENALNDVKRGNVSDTVKSKGKEAYNRAKRRGATEEEALQAQQEAMLKQHYKENKLDDKIKEREKKLKEHQKNASKQKKKYDSYTAEGHADQITQDADGKYVSLKTNYGIGNDWKNFWKGSKEDGKDIGRIIGDGFLKTVKGGIGESTGLDKLVGGTGNLVKDMWHTKWVKQGAFKQGEEKVEGDKLQEKIASEQKETAEAQNRALSEISKSMEALTRATTAQTGVLNNVYTAIKEQGNKDNNENKNNQDDENK